MARCAIQHNGLFGKVRPVAALKLRLVAAPLRARPFAPFGFTKPPLCLAPLRPARAAWRTCAMPHAEQPLASVPVPAAPAQGVPVRRCARSVELAPAHPVGPGALRLWPAPGGGPSAPQGGSLHPRRWSAVALASAVPVPGVGHGSLAHRRVTNPNSLHGAARRAPTPAGHPIRTPSLFVGEGAPAVPGSKGRCAPLARWPAASLDSLAPLTPVSLMRGGVPLHARRAGCHYRPLLFIHH